MLGNDLMRAICDLISAYAKDKGLEHGDNWFIPTCDRVFEAIEKGVGEAEKYEIVIPDCTY